MDFSPHSAGHWLLIRFSQHDLFGLLGNALSLDAMGGYGRDFTVHFAQALRFTVSEHYRRIQVSSLLCTYIFAPLFLSDRDASILIWCETLMSSRWAVLGRSIPSPCGEYEFILQSDLI
jgi:hypothetical protein